MVQNGGLSESNCDCRAVIAMFFQAPIGVSREAPPPLEGSPASLGRQPPPPTARYDWWMGIQEP